MARGGGGTHPVATAALVAQRVQNDESQAVIQLEHGLVQLFNDHAEVLGGLVPTRQLLLEKRHRHEFCTAR